MYMPPKLPRYAVHMSLEVNFTFEEPTATCIQFMTSGMGEMISKIGNRSELDVAVPASEILDHVGGEPVSS